MSGSEKCLQLDEVLPTFANISIWFGMILDTNWEFNHKYDQIMDNEEENNIINGIENHLVAERGGVRAR